VDDMTEITCMSCGHFLAAREAVPGELMSVTCEACGAQMSYRVGSPAATARLVREALTQSQPVEPAPASEEDPPPASGEPSGLSTLFQPGALAGAAEPEPAGEGTQLLRGHPAPPRLQPGQGGFFLVLGAPPDAARITLRSARTVFGRAAQADVDLGDAAISARHFQVELAGTEVYIRDLQSRNGTFVNGRRIRYAELRPGDEVLAGATYLVYRGWHDGLGGEPPPSG
jgi:ribosomal protein S27E